MATAIVTGILENKLYKATDITCCAGDDDTGKVLSNKTGIKFCEQASELPLESDLVILACKPQQLDKIDPAISRLTVGKVVLSIIAGKKIATLEEKFPQARLVIRCMPNTPGSIGEGFTGYTPGAELNSDDKISIEKSSVLLERYSKLKNLG